MKLNVDGADKVILAADDDADVVSARPASTIVETGPAKNTRVNNNKEGGGMIAKPKV